MSGNAKGRKRRFGSVRELSSGTFQARYTGPDGLSRKAPHTFNTKRDAERWLVKTEAEMLSGDWLDPAAAAISLDEYAAQWIRERDLKTRTRQEYDRIFRLHIRPYLGDQTLGEIKPATIRNWRSDRINAGVGRPTIAKAYRILHAIFNTASDDDERIRRNPCRIKGATQYKVEERPTATLDQVFAIASGIAPRYRLLVLLATFAQLRFGELVALRRRNINLASMELRVRKATAELEDGSQVDDDPKSEAGKRPISLPNGLKADIEVHLAKYAEAGPNGRLFVGPQGGIPRRRNFNRVLIEEARGASEQGDSA